MVSGPPIAGLPTRNSLPVGVAIDRFADPVVMGLWGLRVHATASGSRQAGVEVVDEHGDPRSVLLGSNDSTAPKNRSKRDGTWQAGYRDTGEQVEGHLASWRAPAVADS